jgi:hypothetical protein
MYKPDEKDIDRVSREAAEQYHPPGVPDWTKLQQVLDKELPQQKEKKRRGFLFFFLLFTGLSVTGSIAWYGVQLYSADKNNTPLAGGNTASTAPLNNSASATAATKHNTTAVDTIANEANTKSDSRATAGGQQGIENPDAPRAVNKTGATGTTPAVSAGTVTSQNKSIDENAGAAPNATATNTIHNRPATNKKDINGPSASPTTNTSITRPYGKKKSAVAGPYQKRYTSQPAPGIAAASYKGKRTVNRPDAIASAVDQTGAEMAAAKPSASADDESGKSSGMDTVNGKQSIVQNTPVAGAAADTATAHTQPSPATTTDSTSITKPAAKKMVAKKDKAILVGLVAGLDLSTVKFTHNSSTGYNIGLMGGYQFSKRWSVYTGLIYTKKNYTLNGADYHPPKHYWTQYVKLNTVAGFCKMWEIPLLARYTFKPGATTSYFISSGLSSYIMKKQDYTYYYKTNAGVQGTAAWANDSTFNHAFSILHFSAGIQKNIGKHMNWQIEPYAKIPLGGVGFGSIRLSSFGLNFSVQYRQPVKR